MTELSKQAETNLKNDLGSQPIQGIKATLISRESYETLGTLLNDGLTKREWLAGMAMQGWVSNAQSFPAIKETAQKHGQTNIETIAKISVECADALIAELEKEV